MLKIFQAASYFVLLTFVLGLGDWPFVDEILAEQSQVQYEGTTLYIAPITKPEKAKTNHSAGIYKSLVNLADMPVHDLRIDSVRQDAPLSTPQASFTSARPIPLERPPIFS